MTRREQLDTEVRGLIGLLGQKRYHVYLLDREISEITAKIYDLNVEALRLREAAEAAKAELDAQAVPSAEVVVEAVTP